MKGYQRGSIHFYNFHGVGSVQNGRRPCVILSNNKANLYSPTVVVAPITSRKKKPLPIHVPITLYESSIVLLEQLCTINKVDLRATGFICTKSELERIDYALWKELGLQIDNIIEENCYLKEQLLEYIARVHELEKMIYGKETCEVPGKQKIR